MNGIIKIFFLIDFPSAMTVLALLLGCITCYRKSNVSKSDVFLGYLFFFSLGISGMWGFIYHAFFPAIAAKYAGWATSPFQFEVAMANLGVGAVGLFGLKAQRPYHIAGTIFILCYLWGAACGHIIQIVTMNDFSPGNAGFIFYNDLIMPLLLVMFLLFSREEK